MRRLVIVFVVLLGLSGGGAGVEASCGSYLMQLLLRLKSGATAKTRVGENRLIVFVGPAGSLKGTLATRLMKQFQLKSFSVGDALREERDAGTALGKAAEAYMRAGKNAPAEIVAPVIAQFFKKLPPTQGVIMDGFPRKLDQLDLLREALKASGRQLGFVFLFDVDFETSLSRINGRLVCPKCKLSFHEKFAPPKVAGICDTCASPLTRRLDDSPEQARARWDTYQADTLPLVEAFEKQGVLIRLDARQSADQVEQQILATLREK